MKNLTQIFAIAAIAIFCCTQTVQAQSISVKPVAQSTSNAYATFDEITEEITLNMTSAERERVRVMVYDSQGRIFYHNKVDVTSDGIAVIISLEGLDDGMYYLRTKGVTISYSTRFKKK